MGLAEKLQIRAGHGVLVVNRPDEVALDGLPDVARPSQADAFVGFVRNVEELGRIDEVLDAAAADRLAWVAYPKAGKLGTDLNRDRLAAALATRGLQPVRQIAIDETWSGLRFRPA